MKFDNRKKEIIYIPYENLVLDEFNPRLAGDNFGENQEKIIKRIYDDEDIESLAVSLATHGYLPEEPLIVIPQNIQDFDSITQDNISNIKFIVVEGNRRLTSIKLLLNESLRKKIDIDEEDFPQLGGSNDIENSLKVLPTIIYRERVNVDTYLGIRHIAGNRKWESYAKARFIYDKVIDVSKNTKCSISEAILEVEKQIADTKGTIKKLYIYYSVFLVIESSIVNYKSKHIKDRFSLLEVALGAAGTTNTAEFIGLQAFRTIDLDKNSEIIPNKYIENLKSITKWVFGLEEKDSDKIISDSRNISKKLNPVLGNEEAREYLLKYNDLETAYELTDGEEQLVEKSLTKSFNSLKNVLGRISKYKNNENVKSKLTDINRILKDIDTILNDTTL